MSEYERSTSQLPLGVDGEGNVLTDERRTERALELDELLSRVHDLRTELTDVMDVIDTVSAAPHSGQEINNTNGPQLSDLIAHAHSLRVEIAELMEIITKKSSTYYPVRTSDE
jgi:hypothetical protein